MSRSTQRVVLMVVCFIAGWLQVSNAHAVPDFSGVTLPSYKYQPKGFQTCGDGNPLLVGGCQPLAVQGQYTILHQQGGESCPAGYYYLLDDKQQVATTLDTQECDPSLVLDFVKNPVTREVLIVMTVRGEPVNRFTIQ